MAIRDVKFKVSYDISEVIKANEALGDTRVVAKELKSDFDKTNTAASNAAKEIQSGANKSSSALKGIGSQVKDFARDINLFGVNAGQAFDTLDSGVGKGIRGMNLFKVALASTGIGALIVAVGSLIAYFSKIEKGAEQLERIMASVGAVFGVVAGKAGQFGKAIIDAVLNPVESLKALGQLIVDNVVNRFKAVLVVLEGIKTFDFKKIADGFLQGATGVTNLTDKAKALGKGFNDVAKEAANAAKLALDFTERLQDIEDEENNLELTAAKLRNQIQLLFIQSRNRGISEKERIALVKQADAIEVDLVNKQIALQERKVKALSDQNKLLVASGEIDKGNKSAELREAEKELENLRGNSLELRAKFLNREETLDISANKAKKKLREDYANWELEFLSRHGDDVIAVEKKAQEQSEEQALKSYLDKGKEIGQVDDTFTQAQIDNLNFYDSTRAEKERKAVEDSRNAAEQRKAIENGVAQVAFASTSAIFDLRAQKRDAELTDIYIKRDSELRAAEGNKQQQAIIAEKYARQERELKKKQAQDDKLQAIFSIILQTAVGVTRALASSPPPVNFTNAAFVAGLGALQLGVAVARPIPKFNKGTKRVPGIDQGDDSILAMLRPGEGVMPVDRMNDYRPAFNAIFDKKVPAELLNSFVMNYGRLSKGGVSNHVVNNSLDTKAIIKAIESKQEVHIDIDKNGLKTYVKRGVTETQYSNNYFRT